MTKINLSDDTIHKLEVLAKQRNSSISDLIDEWYAHEQNQPKTLFQLIFETAHQAILVIDKDGNYIDANPMACHLLGYSRKKLLTLNTRHLRAENNTRHDSILERFRELGYTESIYRLRKKDGENIYVEFSSVANVIEGVHVAFLRDATEYIRLTSNLDESERYISAIYDDSDIPLFSINVTPNGQFIYHQMSKQHLKAINKTREEVIGKSIDEIDTISIEDRDRFLRKFRQCFDTGKQISYEEQWSFNGQTVMWRTYLNPLRDETGHIYRLIGASYDLSDKVALEREQLRAELLDLELDKANKLSVYKAQVTSMLAHEFQNPLSVINTSIYLLQNNLANATAEMIEERLKRINRQVALLRSLMERMIGLNHGVIMQQDLKLEAVNFPEFVQEIFDDLEMSFPDSSAIEFSHELDEPIILIDKELIRQIITNLTSNAMKYTANKLPIEVRCTINKSYFNIVISDRGIGIPEDELETIFDFFQRGTNVENRQGIGVGLMVVQQAVKRLGGKINISSEVGYGTNVTVTLSAQAIQSMDYT